ncbi:hypothetical protein [Yinghuangia soli]|uniref:DUF2336 domain-containing protein n=1 Tax=Yinghuangia soli TaxID=2908204 RepID=A0AA41Q077_9ACTN|nr:hypothetical protein [Yinghuangia soli]MCF2528366.1 hypothetical protein [Yinghuangia soli]
MNPYALLIDSAPAELQAQLLRRMDTPLRAVILGGRLAPGEVLAAHVLDRGTSEERAALVANRELAPETYLRLADDAEVDADESVAAALYANTEAPREVLLKVVRLVPDELLLPAEPPVGLVEKYACTQRASVLVESPDPALVTRALAAVDPKDNPLGAPAMVLRGCLALARTEGTDAAAAAFASVPPSTGELPEAVRDAFAAPGDPELHSRALAVVGGTSYLLDRFRTGAAARQVGMLLMGPREPLDWELLKSAHRQQPLDPNTTAALSRQLGCPPELRTPLYDAFRGGRGSTRRRLLSAGPTKRQLLTQLPTLPLVPGRDLREAHDFGVMSAAGILADGAPAYSTLIVFEQARDRRLDDVRTAVGDLTRSTLGTDLDAWAVACSLLADFPGTLPELLTTAAAATRAGAE